MDKKYLKENNLYEAHKQFMRLCEITYLPEELQEDGPAQDDPNATPQGGTDMGGGDPNAMGGDPMGGGDPNMGMGDQIAGDPNVNPSVMPPSDPSMEGGADPNMGGDPSMMGGDPMGDPNMGGDEQNGDSDSVIDVDDITNAQEKMNDKVNIVGKDLGKVDDKLASLNATIDKLMALIDKNNSEIEDLKQEFEKRNPTQTEKLNLRSLDSYPFNVNPKDYWKDKGIDSNYFAYGDNTENTDSNKSLEITNSDVDDFDEKTIEDSFNIDDDMQQTIEKIFKL